MADIIRDQSAARIGGLVNASILTQVMVGQAFSNIAKKPKEDEYDSEEEQQILRHEAEIERMRQRR